jgi:hypothetical protein
MGPIVRLFNHNNHSNVTMETKVRSLMLINANDVVLLNNVRKVGELVVSITYCLLLIIT